MNLTEEEIGFIMASMIGSKFMFLSDIAQGKNDNDTKGSLGVILMILDKLKNNISGVYAQNIALLHLKEEENFKKEYGMTSEEIFLSLASKYNNGDQFN